MSRALRGPRRLWWAVVAFGLGACTQAGGGQWTVLAPPPLEASQVLKLTGTIHRLELEGGQYVIRDAKGEQYKPVNLPAAFERDGLAVEAEARRRDDMVSTAMVGPLVELIRIRERTGGK